MDADLVILASPILTMKPEHVWVRLSAVAKALHKPLSSPKDEIDNFDWARALLLGGVSTPSLSLQVDDEDCPDYNGEQFTLPNDSSHLYILPTNEWVDKNDATPPDDLISLTHLHEPAVVYCLEKRFQQDKIYTATGPILIALNPFRELPQLYSEAQMSTYWAAGEGISSTTELPPHVYGSAHVAFRNMMKSLEMSKELKSTRSLKENETEDAIPPLLLVNQSILVSGESGAGKTVTTKHIMRYLATLSQRKAEHLKKKRRAPSPGRSETNLPDRRGLMRRVSARSNSWQAGALIEEKILQSNPILEAFGNARTIRNDNSSRFGKFIELQFKHTGSLIGASIETYLLEKVRLVHQSMGERNFHVFYEMLAAATLQERKQFHLGEYTARDFKMTSQSDCYGRRDGVNDAKLFDNLVLALKTLGFDTETQMDIFGVTVAFLHASNLSFVAVTDDSSQVDGNNPHLQPFLELLGIDEDSFQQAICEFDIEVGSKSYTRTVNKEMAEKGLEAFIKSTYGAMFSYIVQSINKKIDYKEQSQKLHGESTAAFIGVLDIFGFESFPVNSFEQLCINYCNEALQQQFNLFVFKTEQEEYRQEGIHWNFIEFPDNQEVIELIDQKMTGIIPILTDVCRAPRGTDSLFRDAMYKACGDNNRFEADNLQRGHGQFSVLHYAGPVTYDTEGFVEKNKDEIPRGASRLLQSSSKDFVQLLGKITEQPSTAPATSFSSSAPPPTSPSGSARSGGRPNKRPTIGSQFKKQLDELRSRIDKTVPHYIRCLKPNQSLQANEFNKGMIADQLRNAGVLEAIRVSRVGYSQRFEYQHFLDRYRVIDVNSANSVEDLVNSIATMVLSEEDVDEEELSEDPLQAVGIQIGTTKVFLRQIAYDFIESFRSKQLERCSIVIQSAARGFIARQRYSRIHARLIALQALSRGYLVRYQMNTENDSATVIQCMYRSKVARSEVAARREQQRRELAEKKRLAAIAAEKEAALERQQRKMAALEAQEAERTSFEVDELKLELEKLKAELQSARASENASKARTVELEAENRRLKQQLMSSQLEVKYVGRPPSEYANQPDLRDICEGVGRLTQQSRQSKGDLDALVKSLGKLK